MDTNTWTVPPERMKAKRPHRVPLSPAAAAAAQSLLDDAAGDYLFPGAGKGKTLSDMAMLSELKRMKRSDLTVHGFR